MPRNDKLVSNRSLFRNVEKGAANFLQNADIRTLMPPQTALNLTPTKALVAAAFG